jgi:arsenate reductase (thioredoxin)
LRRRHWPIADPVKAAPGDTEATLLERCRVARDQLDARIRVLASLLDLPEGLAGHEFHASIRVADLPAAVRFYAWLLNGWPKEWTHRYATFIRPDLGLNFVLVVADGKALHHDTLYHLGVALETKAAVVDAFHRARAIGVTVTKPPRTTWRGTPLHELWLTDPDGNLIEIYARLTPTELSAMPSDMEPVVLVPAD